MEAFAETGLDTQMDDVARRAGVGVGTLYRHFPTKDALVRALIVFKMERMAAGRRGAPGRRGRRPVGGLLAASCSTAPSATHATAPSARSSPRSRPAGSAHAAMVETELASRAAELLARAQRRRAGARRRRRRGHPGDHVRPVGRARSGLGPAGRPPLPGPHARRAAGVRRQGAGAVSGVEELAADREARSAEIVDVLAEAFEPLIEADPRAFRRKFRKMAADPFAFYRGSAPLFYADVVRLEDPWADERTEPRVDPGRPARRELRHVHGRRRACSSSTSTTSTRRTSGTSPGTCGAWPRASRCSASPRRCSDDDDRAS